MIFVLVVWYTFMPAQTKRFATLRECEAVRQDMETRSFFDATWALMYDRAECVERWPY